MPVACYTTLTRKWKNLIWADIEVKANSIVVFIAVILFSVTDFFICKIYPYAND